MSSAKEFIEVLSQMMDEQQLRWEANAGKTGYLASLGDITVELSQAKDSVGSPVRYVLQVRDANGTELTRYKEAHVTTSVLPLRKLFGKILNSESQAAWSAVMDAVAKYRSRDTQS